MENYVKNTHNHRDLVKEFYFYWSINLFLLIVASTLLRKVTGKTTADSYET